MADETPFYETPPAGNLSKEESAYLDDLIREYDADEDVEFALRNAFKMHAYFNLERANIRVRAIDA
jgi:hypothetical protein